MKRWSALRKLLLSFSVILSLLCPFLLSAETPKLGSIVYPIMTPRVSSKYGARKHPIYKVSKHHNGVDLAVPISTPIRAIQSGTVVFADPHGGYGNLVVILHKENLTSHYGHCDEIRVQPGEQVNAGQIIGTVGKTGNVTGPHLHLEVRIDGKPQDPSKLIPSLSGGSKG